MNLIKRIAGVLWMMAGNVRYLLSPNNCNKRDK